MNACKNTSGSNLLDTECLWLPDPYIFKDEQEFEGISESLMRWLDDYNGEWEVRCGE